MSSESSRPKAARLFGAFQYRSFTALWSAMVLSSSGVWINEIAVGWVMTELTDSPVYVSLIQACTTAPIFVFGLLAGALGDQVDRRKYLLTVEFCLVCIALAFAAAVISGVVSPPLLLVLTLMTGTGLAFSSPVRQAVLANLVPKSQLGSAFTLNAIGYNGARAAGPAVGGLIISLFGVVAAIATTALSFFSVFCVLLNWKSTLPDNAVASGQGRQLWRQTLAGWTYLWSEEMVRNAVIRHFFFMFGASAFWALLPLQARALSQGDAFLYSVAVAIVGIGSVVGGFPVPRIMARFGPEAALGGGLFLTIVSFLALALDVSIYAGFVSLACFGIGWISVSAVIGTTVQTHSVDAYRSRVMSLLMVEYAGAMMLGSVIWGLVGSVTNLRVAFFCAAITIILGWMLAVKVPLQRDYVQ